LIAGRKPVAQLSGVHDACERAAWIRCKSRIGRFMGNALWRNIELVAGYEKIRHHRTRARDGDIDRVATALCFSTATIALFAILIRCRTLPRQACPFRQPRAIVSASSILASILRRSILHEHYAK
jgi:hypothetical protein